MNIKNPRKERLFAFGKTDDGMICICPIPENWSEIIVVHPESVARDMLQTLERLNRY